MSSTKPNVVIVPGAWQKATGFAGLVESISAAGFPAEVVPLPSVGSFQDPLPGLPEDVVAVRNVVGKFVDEGRDVVLLCHSYGGVVSSCAVEGFDFASRKAEAKTGGVIMTIFMAAFMVPKGNSLLDLLGGQPLPWMRIEGGKCFAQESALAQVAFNDFSEEEAAQYISDGMSHTSAVVFGTPSTFEPWSNGYPCAYIFFSEDKSLQYPIQQHFATQLGPDPTTFTVKGGHCAFLRLPEDVVAAVAKAAEVGLNKKA
ncbi:hypothetical protein PVAG01_05404 [Phlyctema vagabunda]|uniref:AB hydrolase-1 domain-containing protein n=1 Tax=Phlyctema vagabunda TaxID=108571 RepID=A0ABR4PJX9_9HELO